MGRMEGRERNKKEKREEEMREWKDIPPSPWLKPRSATGRQF